MTTRIVNTIEDLTGVYGPRYRQGVCTDHVFHAVQDAGAQIKVLTSHRVVLTGPQGGKTYPVLCGELVNIDTEDGPVDGRCGEFAFAPKGEDGPWGCPGHVAQQLAWAELSESEKAYREYQEEFA
jgi:hypothetical protein